jgi:hypothetical protein
VTQTLTIIAGVAAAILVLTALCIIAARGAAARDNDGDQGADWANEGGAIPDVLFLHNDSAGAA